MTDEANPFSRDQQSPSDGTIGHVPTSKKRGPWIWLIPLILCLVGGPLICCGGVAFFGYNMMSAPVDAAVVALNDDSRVTAKLGSPITSSAGMNVSQLNIENGNGEAQISFNAIGPDGSASISGEMQSIASVWSPSNLEVTFTDGTTITLPEGQPVLEEIELIAPE